MKATVFSDRCRDDAGIVDSWVQDDHGATFIHWRLRPDPHCPMPAGSAIGGRCNRVAELIRDTNAYARISKETLAGLIRECEAMCPATVRARQGSSWHRLAIVEGSAEAHGHSAEVRPAITITIDDADAWAEPPTFAWAIRHRSGDFECGTAEVPPDGFAGLARFLRHCLIAGPDASAEKCLTLAGAAVLAAECVTFDDSAGLPDLCESATIDAPGAEADPERS